MITHNITLSYYCPDQKRIGEWVWEVKLPYRLHVGDELHNEFIQGHSLIEGVDGPSENDARLFVDAIMRGSCDLQEYHAVEYISIDHMGIIQVYLKQYERQQ